MKLYYLLFLFFFKINLSFGQEEIQNKKFKRILNRYMKTYSKVNNNCNGKTYYAVVFSVQENNIGFVIYAFIGEPSSVPPTKPGNIQPSNPLEKKGFFLHKNHKIIFCDFKYSKGYNIYNPSMLKEYDSCFFESLPMECTNTIYPGGWCYIINEKGKIKLIIKEKEFFIK